MTASDIKKQIGSLCSHVLFDYEGHACGVDPIATDEYDMWCGNDYMKARSINEVMTTPFFKGKALEDITDQIRNIE